MGIHQNKEAFEKEKEEKEEIFDHVKIESIKSLYITKIIFSFLSDNVKLNLIKFNKKYQNKLGINIEYFEKLYGKFKIQFKNGIGRIYLSDMNRLIFEGEYSNGLKNGKGKEYYDNGKLKFEGEYLNGKKWNGKIYNKYFDHIELEIKSGKGRGRGREFLNDYIFNGKYINGQKNGWGYEYYYNNYEYSFSKEILKFVGDYYNDEKINGKEYDIYLNLILSIENRRIKEYYRNREIKFEGEYLNGKRWNGKFYTKDNKQYEVINGSSFIKEDSGVLSDYFQGTYVNGEKNGKGYIKEGGCGTLCEGEYKNEKKNGYGKEYNHDYYLVYEGDFLNGEKSGKIKEYFTKDNIELIFDGEYLYNHRRRGKEYKDGKLIYEGEYLFDKK